MSAAQHLAWVADGSYRQRTPSDTDITDAATRHLGEASDALSLAVLTLSGTGDETKGERARRAEQARGFVVEAVTALSKARVYVPRIRTLALPCVMASERDVEAELVRLHQIATRLSWQNHVYLPARFAKPLEPEEEAQLAVVLDGLARNTRLYRAMRYRWVVVMLAVAGTSAALGMTGIAAALGVSSLVVMVWIYTHLLRGSADTR